MSNAFEGRGEDAAQMFQEEGLKTALLLSGETAFAQIRPTTAAPF